MPRKKLTKKTNKTAINKRQSKLTALTVAEILKQLPKQFKKELTALKKQAKKLTAALKKAEKQKKKAHAALAKKSMKGKTSVTAKKTYDRINQTIAHLTLQLETAQKSMTFLSEKQDALIALSKPLVNKAGKSKQKKIKTEVKSQKKRLKSPVPVTLEDENTKTTLVNEPETVISTSEELETEFN